MDLAIFDLDDTLLKGSCDFIWEDHLVENGILSEHDIAVSRAYFVESYNSGSFDACERQECFLSMLSPFPLRQLNTWLTEFVKTEISSFIYPQAQQLIEHHKTRGDRLLMLSAASHFIVNPIAKLLGIEQAIATEPEVIGEKFTGKIIGMPCFNGHKVSRLKQWLKVNRYHVNSSTFYTDSSHDLPLLELVTRPIAVNPDMRLQHAAKNRDWEVMCFE